MSEDDADAGRLAIAELASEYWKLLRNYDHVLAAAPENLRAGLAAQAKFGARKLATILAGAGMRVETFDGAAFSVNLPVTAVNADDFADESTPVIEQTLEPAIIFGTAAIRTGRVYLRASNK